MKMPFGESIIKTSTAKNATGVGVRQRSAQIAATRGLSAVARPFDYRA